MAVLATRTADNFKLPDYVRGLDDNSVFRRRVCKRCDFKITTIEIEVKVLDKSVEGICAGRITQAVKEARNKMAKATILNLEKLIER